MKEDCRIEEIVGGDLSDIEQDGRMTLAIKRVTLADGTKINKRIADFDD